MSKDSIRNKIEEAKVKTNVALASGKVSPEIRAAVETLLLVIEILSAVFLEKKVRKTSSNSGLPPSQNKGSNGNRNKGTGSPAGLGDAAGNTRHIETIERTSPFQCAKCGEVLSDVQARGKEERKKIDIIYEIVTHTVEAEIKKCPCCGQTNKGPFPAGMDGKIQYGDGIKAAIINYSTVQMMSLQRVQEHMMGLLGRQGLRI